jgi:hypothetical protein
MSIRIYESYDYIYVYIYILVVHVYKIEERNDISGGGLASESGCITADFGFIASCLLARLWPWSHRQDLHYSGGVECYLIENV